MSEPIRLIIELLPDGRVNVNGPLVNRLLCYGLLEVARDVITDHSASSASSIVKPHFGPFPPKPGD